MRHCDAEQLRATQQVVDKLLAVPDVNHLLLTATHLLITMVSYVNNVSSRSLEFYFVTHLNVIENNIASFITY